jgi:hypothetical protein
MMMMMMMMLMDRLSRSSDVNDVGWKQGNFNMNVSFQPSLGILRPIVPSP